MGDQKGTTKKTKGSKARVKWAKTDEKEENGVREKAQKLPDKG